ncbi:hypothetical protein V9T40_013971 [Parthenolecanium corni]|uniref:RING-type domain-containing protein n=1 Tax=Parthenolecanium corni TaxID=536013 RepID=A0AAN9TFW0_9HEMI
MAAAATVTEVATCPICRDNLVQMGPSGDSENIYATECGHVYHGTCLRELFRVQRQSPELDPHCAVCRRPGDDVYPLYITNGALDSDDVADTVNDLNRRLQQTERERDEAQHALQDVLAEMEEDRKGQRELFQVMENNLISILNESSALRAENARLRHAAASSRRQPAAAAAEPAAAEPAAAAAVLPPPIREPSRSMYDRIDRPTKARCFYCGEIGHWSFLCTERATLESRREYIAFKGLQNSRMVVPSYPCEWLFCGQRDHISSLCPNAVYPVTREIQELHYRQLRFVKYRMGVLPPPQRQHQDEDEDEQSS